MPGRVVMEFLSITEDFKKMSALIKKKRARWPVTDSCFRNFPCNHIKPDRFTKIVRYGDRYSITILSVGF